MQLGFVFKSFSFATKVLYFPISSREYNICLAKLLFSIKSPSKKVKFFIPDETKYCVKGQPIPPSPMIVILALFNFCIFSSLKFCKINCLENI